MGNSQEAEQLYDQGNTAFREGKFDEAHQLMTRTLELDPAHWKAQTNRGVIRMMKGDLQGALADYDAVIAACPDYADAYFNRANVYLKQGKLNEALADLNKVIELQPNSADAYFNRGNTLFQARRNDRTFYFPTTFTGGAYNTAINDFTKAIELNPNLAVAYSSRGGLHLEVLMRTPPPQPGIPQMMMRPEQTQAWRETTIKSISSDIDRAIELDPKHSEYFKNRGVLHLVVMNNPQAAITDLTRAIELNPNFVDALIFRVAAYNKLGRFTEAEQDCDRALKLRPGDPGILFNRGVNRRLNGNQQGAVDDLTEVIKKDPKNIKAYANRAEAYTAVKDKKAAAADWETYLSLGGGKMFGDEKAVQEKIKKLKSFWPF